MHAGLQGLLAMHTAARAGNQEQKQKMLKSDSLETRSR